MEIICDRSLPRLTGAFLRAWLRLRHGAFWGCAPAPWQNWIWLIDWFLFVKLQELHIVTAHKPLIHQNQPVACYQHRNQPCMLYFILIDVQHSTAVCGNHRLIIKLVAKLVSQLTCRMTFGRPIAAHRHSSASHAPVLPQHPRWEIVPYRVGWNHLTIDFRGSVCLLIDTWLKMSMFSASE